MVSELHNVILNPQTTNTVNITTIIPAIVVTSSSVTTTSTITSSISTNSSFLRTEPIIASRVVGTSTFIHENQSGIRLNQNLYTNLNLPGNDIFNLYNQRFAPDYQNWRPPPLQMDRVLINSPRNITTPNEATYIWDYGD